MSTNPVTARAATAAALRDLGNHFVEHEVAPDLLHRIGVSARDLTEAVRSSPRLTRAPHDLRADISATPPLDGAAMDHYPGCPVSGQDNPLGLAVEFTRSGDDVVARVIFGVASSGMPGVAHGGPIAAVFDDLMGFVLTTMNGLAGFTATLTVSYRAPVPIGREIEYRGRLARRDGRKLYIESTAHDIDGTLLAEATGLFIQIPIDSVAGAATS